MLAAVVQRCVTEEVPTWLEALALTMAALGVAAVLVLLGMIAVCVWEERRSRSGG